MITPFHVYVINGQTPIVLMTMLQYDEQKVTEAVKEAMSLRSKALKAAKSNEPLDHRYGPAIETDKCIANHLTRVFKRAFQICSYTIIEE